MQTRTSCLISAPLNCLDLRYRVYLSEIRKRSAYIGFSLVLTFLCAYTQRVSLMYCTTLSLQRALSRESLAFSEQHLFSDGVESGCTERGDTVRLIFTDVEEAFYTLLSVSFFWCVLAFTPVLLYHILCFFQPGLHAWQSKRAWLFLCTRIILLLILFKLVDLFVIPRLLHFFYSFEIQRLSLCLAAETKVVSYVSLYLFVYLIALLFGILAGLWVSYKQKGIIHLFLSTHPSFKKERFAALTYNHTATNTQADNDLTNKKDWGASSYKGQRGKVWWGCLLLAALISPPELFSQCSFHLFLVFFSEMSIWLAYISSCRALRRDHYLAST